MKALMTTWNGTRGASTVATQTFPTGADRHRVREFCGRWVAAFDEWGSWSSAPATGRSCAGRLTAIREEALAAAGLRA